MSPCPAHFTGNPSLHRHNCSSTPERPSPNRAQRAQIQADVLLVLAVQPAAAHAGGAASAAAHQAGLQVPPPTAVDAEEMEEVQLDLQGSSYTLVRRHHPESLPVSKARVTEEAKVCGPGGGRGVVHATGRDPTRGVLPAQRRKLGSGNCGVTMLLAHNGTQELVAGKFLPRGRMVRVCAAAPATAVAAVLSGAPVLMHSMLRKPSHQCSDEVHLPQCLQKMLGCVQAPTPHIAESSMHVMRHDGQ